MCGIFGDFFEEIEEEKIKTFLENLFAPVCRSRQWGEAVAVLFGPDQVEVVSVRSICFMMSKVVMITMMIIKFVDEGLLTI